MLLILCLAVIPVPSDVRYRRGLSLTQNSGGGSGPKNIALHRRLSKGTPESMVSTLPPGGFMETTQEM